MSNKKTILESIKDLATQVLNLNTPETDEVVDAPVAEAIADVIDEVVENEATPEVAPEVAEVVAEAPEFVTKADFEAVINDLRSQFSAHKSKVESEIAEEKAKVEKAELKAVELQKALDNKPDAKPIANQPKEKVNLSEAPASTKKGRIYQFLNSKK
jgi:hypothetical protein